ncbi:MAG: hypothetical protein L6Q83_11460, partial [Gammaproteobacteria bacterium]|nr:hypothetical protein [Gammaproteobacteria bacterium]
LLAGYSVNQTVAIMATLGSIGVAFGLASTLWNWPDLVVAVAFLVVGLMYFWMIMHSWRVMRFFRKSICRRNTVISDRRSGVERRCGNDAAYMGPERRSGLDRRQGLPRRAEDAERCRIRSRSGLTGPFRPASETVSVTDFA